MSLLFVKLFYHSASLVVVKIHQVSKFSRFLETLFIWSIDKSFGKIDSVPQVVTENQQFIYVKMFKIMDILTKFLTGFFCTIWIWYNGWIIDRKSWLRFETSLQSEYDPKYNLNIPANLLRTMLDFDMSIIILKHFPNQLRCFSNC